MHHVLGAGLVWAAGCLLRLTLWLQHVLLLLLLLLVVVTVIILLVMKAVTVRMVVVLLLLLLLLLPLVRVLAHCAAQGMTHSAGWHGWPCPAGWLQHGTTQRQQQLTACALQCTWS